MSLADIQMADRRLIILRALADDPDYAINNFVLHGLLAEYGHGVPSDVVASDIAWLEEQTLLSAEDAGPNMIVATITQRGVDVAAGRARVPGVARPRPGM
jgi:hypothetical protein